jgi:hypothetical protein
MENPKGQWEPAEMSRPASNIVIPWKSKYDPSESAQSVQQIGVRDDKEKKAEAARQYKEALQRQMMEEKERKLQEKISRKSGK